MVCLKLLEKDEQVMTGKDSKNCFARWGKTGKKYYYRCGDAAARKRAQAKAAKQGRATFVNR